jgi:DNA-binding XRE family transcriptional regulator
MRVGSRLLPVPKKYRGPTDDEVKLSIAAWIDDFLTRTDKKNVWLADELGVSEATISNIRLGKYMPGFTMLVRLHFALGAHLPEVLRHDHKGRTAKPVARK